MGKFSYLGNMLNAGGGADLVVVARERCALKKFRELSPLLTLKVYGSCVPCIGIPQMYGRKTWKKHESMLERTEM